jgi:phage shock protein E
MRARTFAATTVARPLAVLALVACTSVPGPAQEPFRGVNPAIDMEAFLRSSARAARHRETRRLSEADFIRLSRTPGAVILDARSREKYDELHVRGAVNLSFPDIAFTTLARTIPDRDTRILIYCNNNFKNAEGPFPGKMASVSLNLSTYVTLYNYGYRNVYELGPLLDPRTSMLELESSPRASTRR